MSTQIRTQTHLNMAPGEEIKHTFNDRDKVNLYNLVSRVIYSTIDFIWSNQVGQVANRFSRDMNEVDLILPGTIKNFIYQVQIGNLENSDTDSSKF